MAYPPRTVQEVKDETVELLKYYARTIEDDGHNLKVALHSNNQEMIDAMLSSIDQHALMLHDHIVRYVMGRQIHGS